MTYEIGQQVETPFGVGEVVALGSAFNGVESYRVRFTLPKDENGYLHPIIEFPHYHLKPYKKAHEKLLEIGFEVYLNDDYTIIYFNKTTYQFVKIDKKFKTYQSYWEDESYNYNPHFITLELSRILTQYLEELAE